MLSNHFFIIYPCLRIIVELSSLVRVVPPKSTLFPYTTLFRSCRRVQPARRRRQPGEHGLPARALGGARRRASCLGGCGEAAAADECGVDPPAGLRQRAARRSGFVARRARRGTCGPVRPRLDLVGGGTPIGVRRP